METLYQLVEESSKLVRTNATDMNINQDSVAIANMVYDKKAIKKMSVINIEHQFINSANALDHIVLDAWTQTGIFASPKFYVCLKVIINETVLLIRISKKAVSFGSKQYEKDKLEASNIIKALK